MEGNEFKPILLYQNKNLERIYNICSRLKAQYGAAFTPWEINTRYLDVFHYSWDLKELDEFVGLLKKNYAQKGKSVEQLKFLEIGGAIGGPSRYIAWKHNIKVDCIELLQDQVDLANQINALFDSPELNKFEDKIKMITGDFLKMDLTAFLNQYDGIFVQGVMCHIGEKQEFLRRLQTCLKPGGHFFINEWGVYDNLDTREVQLAVDTWSVVGEIPTKPQWENLFQNANLVLTELRDVTEEVSVFLWERYQRYATWFEDPNAEDWQKATEEIKDGYGIGPRLFRQLKNYQDYPKTYAVCKDYAGKPNGMSELFFFGIKAE